MVLVACSGSELDGEWERDTFDGRGGVGMSVYVFSRNQFTHYIYWNIESSLYQERVVRNGYEWFRISRTGNFSISSDQWGNRVELVFDDGHIRVLPFTRTENTLTLDGRDRYTRR